MRRYPTRGISIVIRTRAQPLSSEDGSGCELKRVMLAEFFRNVKLPREFTARFEDKGALILTRVIIIKAVNTLLYTVLMLAMMSCINVELVTVGRLLLVSRDLGTPRRR